MVSASASEEGNPREKSWISRSVAGPGGKALTTSLLFKRSNSCRKRRPSDWLPKASPSASVARVNAPLCQEFVNSSNPLLIANAEIFKRKDYFGLANLLKFLSKHVNLFSQSDDKSRIDILHSSLGSIGFSNFTNLKTVQNKDLKNATGIYFINNSFSSFNIKKLLNLKLLNLFQDHTLENKILITQKSNLDTKLIAELKKGFNWNTHLHLPTTVFFESSGTYINTEGNVSKVSRVVKPLGQTKDNWRIIRKMFSYSKKMLFMNNFLNDNKLTFNSNNLSHFTSYIGFQYYAVSNLNNLAFSFFKTIVGNRQYTVKFKSKKKKIFSSQFRFWLNDFYIDNKNFSSNYSSTMIHCSKLSRLKSSNFKI